MTAAESQATTMSHDAWVAATWDNVRAMGDAYAARSQEDIGAAEVRQAELRAVGHAAGWRPPWDISGHAQPDDPDADLGPSA